MPSLMHSRRVVGIGSRMWGLMFTRRGIAAALAEGENALAVGGRLKREVETGKGLYLTGTARAVV